MKYEYFVSYFQGTRFGRATLRLKKAINDEEDIKFVEDLIDKKDKKGGNGTVLMFFQLLKCIESTEPAQAEGKIITEDMVNGNDCPNGSCS